MQHILLDDLIVPCTGHVFTHMACLLSAMLDEGECRCHDACWTWSLECGNDKALHGRSAMMCCWSLVLHLCCTMSIGNKYIPKRTSRCWNEQHLCGPILMAM